MSFNGWRVIKLGEVCKFQKGYAFKSKDYQNTGRKIIKVSDLNSYCVNNDGCICIDESKTEDYLRYQLKHNDIIITTVGSWPSNPNSVVGKVVKVQKEIEGSLLNQNAVRVRGNSLINQKYIFFRLKNNDFFVYIIGTAQGAANQASITQNDIKNFEFRLPRLEEQQAIAATLSCLDDKIELNNRIYKTLEKMAQTIFKSWFIDFEPFQDGEFEDSELGWIPKGWRVGTLDEITCKFATGLNPRKNFKLGQGDNYYVTIKSMVNNNVILGSICDQVTDEAILKINKRSDLKKGDLLFSGIGTIGRVYLIDRTPENWNISESVFTMRPNELYTSELLYLLLLSERMQDYAQSSASGSVQKGIRMADLKKFKVLIPPNEIVHKVSDILRTIIANIKSNHHQNGYLIQTRDTLLPKLMSGEIRVPIEEVL